MQKLKLIATALDAVILRPYPVSAFFRLHRDRDGLQIDFIAHIDGIKSYESVRDRAGVYRVGGQKLLAASLEDIIRSKAAAGREKVRAVIDILKKQPARNQRTAQADKSTALKRESERALTELFRYRLSLPPEKRLNCLRRKIGMRATCL